MKYVITTVSDRLTGCKGLVLEQNIESAKRSFIQAVRNENSIIYANKEDFELLELGTYDSDLAVIEVLPTPKVIIKGCDVNNV